MGGKSIGSDKQIRKDQLTRQQIARNLRDCEFQIPEPHN